MRINKKEEKSTGYSIYVLDDDQSITLALEAFFEASGYDVTTGTDPEKAILELKEKPCDILLLDFLMTPLRGDEVVAQIRGFNKDMYIVLLTGHKDLAPPVKTIRALDIQGYYEKSDRFDQLELLVESCVKSIAQMRTIRKYRDGLAKILDSVPMIYQLQPLNGIIHTILKQLLPLVNSEDAFILIENSLTEEVNMIEKSIFCGIGRFDLPIQDFVHSLFPALFDVIGQVRQSGNIINSQGYLIVPLKTENSGSLGVLGIQAKQIGEIESQLFELFARQASSAISNAFLHSLVNMKNQELEDTYRQLRESYLQTVGALRLLVDAKDIYTRGHSDRVSYFCEQIAKKLGKDEEYIRRIKLAGLFHDVGKVGVADDILLKNSSLTPAEYAEIKKHPQRGANILSAISFLDDISPLVKYHHERYDGTGYPSGLKGTQIPEEARIIAAADAFDAMTSERQYRDKLPLSVALEELKRGKNKQFDGEIIDAFLDVLQDYEAIRKQIDWTFNQLDPQNIRIL